MSIFNRYGIPYLSALFYIDPAQPRRHTGTFYIRQVFWLPDHLTCCVFPSPLTIKLGDSDIRQRSFPVTAAGPFLNCTGFHLYSTITWIFYNNRTLLLKSQTKYLFIKITSDVFDYDVKARHQGQGDEGRTDGSYMAGGKMEKSTMVRLLQRQMR